MRVNCELANGMEFQPATLFVVWLNGDLLSVERINDALVYIQPIIREEYTVHVLLVFTVVRN